MTPPTSDLSRIDGAAFAAISITHAYGCGGPETLDEADGKAVFIRPGHIDDTDEGALDQLDEHLDNLWPSPGATSPYPDQAAAAAALGVDLPAASLPPVPLWTADFRGTLADFLAANRECRAVKKEAEEALKAACLRARLELLHQEGFTPVAIERLPRQCTITYDYGCRCMCWTGGVDGQPNKVLAVRDGAVYVTPAGADLDALLAESVQAGERVRAAVAAKNVEWAEKATLPRTGIDEFQLARDPENPILAMTWQQWDAQRRSTRDVAQQKAAHGVATGAWGPLLEFAHAGWGQHCGVQDPHSRERYGAWQFLYQHGVERLDTITVTALWGVLLPGIPVPDGLAVVEDSPVDGGQESTQSEAGVRGTGRVAPPL